MTVRILDWAESIDWRVFSSFERVSQEISAQSVMTSPNRASFPPMESMTGVVSKLSAPDSRTYQPGDRVLALRVPSGHVVLIGDGPVSIDSRTWGYVPLDRVLGVVVCRLWRAA